MLKGYPPSNTISPSVKVSDKDVTYTAVISQPDAMVSQEDYWIPIRSSSGNHITLKDSNNFVDLSDDANSLQQLSSGNGNLDMYYSTQLDADGNEYNLETGTPVAIPSVSGHSIAYDPYPHLKDDDYVPTVMDPESFCPRQRKKSEVIAEMAKRKETKLEIGAGSKIWQDIGYDPESLDFWQEEPAGLIYVNYVTEEKAQEIMSAGKIASKREGFLNGCLVGS
jgi:hypothetical protein